MKPRKSRWRNGPARASHKRGFGGVPQRRLFDAQEQQDVGHAQHGAQRDDGRERGAHVDAALEEEQRVGQQRQRRGPLLRRVPHAPKSIQALVRQIVAHPRQPQRRAEVQHRVVERRQRQSASRSRSRRRLAATARAPARPARKSSAARSTRPATAACGAQAAARPRPTSNCMHTRPIGSAPRMPMCKPVAPIERANCTVAGDVVNCV